MISYLVKRYAQIELKKKKKNFITLKAGHARGQ